MLTLNFDTNFNRTYIVIKKDNQFLENVLLDSQNGNYHSAFFFPKLQELLKKNDLLIKDFDAIGADIGPGSFTGIRAGITIARVLCQQANIKLVGVNSLKILSMINNTDKPTTVVLDARKNRVYYARFDRDNSLVEPKLFEKDELKDIINIEDSIITDSSINEYLSTIGVNSVKYEDNDLNFGLYLAQIVSDELDKNLDDYNWAKVRPLYIQQPSITKPKEVK